MLLVAMTARASFCMRKLSSLVHFEEETNARESGPFFALISENLRATRSRASSQEASRNLPFSRIRGEVSRSGLFTKSHPNFPLMQVEMPFVVRSRGCVLRMLGFLVQTVKRRPT